MGIGVLSWFIGYFLVLITQWTMPPLIDNLDSTLGGIMWIGVIIVWLLSLIVVPLGIIIYALTTPENNKQPLFQMITGILYGLFTWLLVYVAWYATDNLANLMVNELTLAFYWIGLTLLILLNGIGVPCE